MNNEETKITIGGYDLIGIYESLEVGKEYAQEVLPSRLRKPTSL